MDGFDNQQIKSPSLLGEGDLGGEVKLREGDGGWVKKQPFFRIFVN
jgi:hypothetical protein